MKFEVSERIVSSEEKEKIIGVMQEQFKKIAHKVVRKGDDLEVSLIEASFGSINRKDVTTVTIREIEDGYLVVADVNYRPSIAFWIILFVTLFSAVFWLVPIVFYVIQKKTVRGGIEAVFARLKNEFLSAGGVKKKRQDQVDFGQLEKLASLKDSGAITEEEYQVKKKEMLAL